jgi:hypothetical protein
MSQMPKIIFKKINFFEKLFCSEYFTMKIFYIETIDAVVAKKNLK